MAQTQYSLFDALPETAPVFDYGRELSPQQAKVRDHGVGNQVVVAGAGTGKTEALTQRILKLLVEGDGESGPVELESVLALTFTDKGAAEMRGRVYARLVQILRSLPRGEQRSQLERVRAGFAENNRILTFDAFSFRLLGQFPEHSPFSPDVDILDGGARRQLRRDVTRQFWNRVESTFSPDQKMALWELLDIFSSRRAALETIWKLAEDETEEDLRHLARLPEETQWRAEFDAQIAQDAEKLWRAVESEMARVEQVQPLSVAIRRELLDQELILHGGHSSPITKTDWSAAFKKTHAPDLIPGFERVGRRLREWKAEASIERDYNLDWRSRRAVAQLCQHSLWWQGAHREWCQGRGVAAFADIAAAAVDLLGRSEVAARLRASYSHILIDEFQDTNWRQWALIEELRDAAHGNVLLVGDEKQAIFRFRGGDITVFDGVRKILLHNKSADELTVSRRSTRQLVQWTNDVFRTVLPSVEMRATYEAPFQALQSETETDVNGLWRLVPPDWHTPAENEPLREKLPPLAIQRERAARALARFLRQLCDDAALWQSSETPKLRFPELNAISQKIARGQNAIGVVFTSHAVKSTFETQLRAYNVPFIAVKGTGFWSSDPVTWTLHWLRLLLDGTDRTAFVGLARSPLGGLSDVALMEWHLALQEDEDRPAGASAAEIIGFTPSRHDDALAWALFAARLQHWRDLARVEAASEVLEIVLEETELAFYEAGLPNAAQREENWRKILDLLREREADEEGGLRALIDHLSSLVREAENGDKEADAPLPSQGSIQLMTVWASKGLGFPMTVLAQLDDSPRAEGGHLLRATLNGQRQMAFGLSEDEEDEKSPKPWLWEKLKAQEFAEEEAQWRRLFYVACTRAESQLVLLCPEREVKNAAAWTNLSSDGQLKMQALRPVEPIPEVQGGTKDDVAVLPGPLAPPLPRTRPREMTLSEITGSKADRFTAKARDWMESRLTALGGIPEEIREEVPFSAPSNALGLNQADWIVGAWEWLAPLPDGKILLLATGETSELAQTRVKLMALAARSSRLELLQAWALSPSGEEIDAVQCL